MLSVSDDQGEQVISEKLNIDAGLNFIKHNLFSKTKDKYLSKGEYAIMIKNEISSEEIKLIIK